MAFGTVERPGVPADRMEVLVEDSAQQAFGAKRDDNLPGQRSAIVPSLAKADILRVEGELPDTVQVLPVFADPVRTWVLRPGHGPQLSQDRFDGTTLRQDRQIEHLNIQELSPDSLVAVSGQSSFPGVKLRPPSLPAGESCSR